jgi:hypothetical protein
MPIPLQIWQSGRPYFFAWLSSCRFSAFSEELVCIGPVSQMHQKKEVQNAGHRIDSGSWQVQQVAGSFSATGKDGSTLRTLH